MWCFLRALVSSCLKFCDLQIEKLKVNISLELKARLGLDNE